jgi:hypothetical protein
MKFREPKAAGDFLTNCATIRFSVFQSFSPFLYHMVTPRSAFSFLSASFIMNAVNNHTQRKLKYVVILQNLLPLIIFLVFLLLLILSWCHSFIIEVTVLRTCEVKYGVLVFFYSFSDILV